MKATEQKVSVPRDEVERLVKLLRYQAHPYPSPHAEFWQGLLDAPAAQHQGEPVAMPDRDAMRVAFTACKYHAPHIFEAGWNACLDEIAKLGPLYTHANPSEVERLRAELESSYTVAEHERLVAKGQEINVSCIRSLRAQLAERDALLSKALADIEFIQKECGGDVSPVYIGCLVDDLHDLLSASAEPSAPVEIDERAEFEAWKLRSQVGEHTNAGAALTASRRGPSVLVDRAEWVAVSGPGQIQIGDWLSFSVAGKILCAQAKEILNPGSAKEEIIYNRKKNHYFITTMAIAGTSSHRGVMQARASLGQTTDLSVIADAKRWRFYAPKVAQIIGESLSEMCRVVDSAMPNPACAICKDLGDQCMECSEQANLNALLKTTPGDNGPDTEHGDF